MGCSPHDVRLAPAHTASMRSQTGIIAIGPSALGLARRRLVHRKGSDHLLDDRIALGANLLVGGILDRMRHEDPRSFGQAQRGRLSLGGVDKYIGRDDDRGFAVILEPYGVVQTARYAGPSIS
jgi:hypothetical protein